MCMGIYEKPCFSRSSLILKRKLLLYNRYHSVLLFNVVTLHILRLVLYRRENGNIPGFCIIVYERMFLLAILFSMLFNFEIFVEAMIRSSIFQESSMTCWPPFIVLFFLLFFFPLFFFFVLKPTFFSETLGEGGLVLCEYSNSSLIPCRAHDAIDGRRLERSQNDQRLRYIVQ